MHDNLPKPHFYCRELLHSELLAQAPWIDKLPSEVRRVEPVGSRVSCSPPPNDTDRDWLVYVWPDDWDKFLDGMFADEWKIGGSQPEHFDAASFWNSFTKEIDGTLENVVATSDFGFYSKFLKATAMAKRWNLLEKDDRIALFQLVLYGN